MLKKSITYTDFANVERTETFRFHLSEPEIIAMDLRQKGGLEKYLTRIVSEMDGGALIDFITEFIAKSYGELDDEGKYFMKNEKIMNRFVCSAAYPVLFDELIQGGDAASDFLNALVPKPKKAT